MMVWKKYWAISIVKFITSMVTRVALSIYGGTKSRKKTKASHIMPLRIRKSIMNTMIFTYILPLESV